MEKTKYGAIKIDGKKVATEIKEEISNRVAELSGENKKLPHLAIIMVGDDGASQTYVDNKVKAAKSVGFHYTLLRFAETISEEKLLKHIEQINQDDDVDGLIVQLPLPDHISVERVTEMIKPEKDVDGFTNQNFGSIVSEEQGILPATPFGVMELLKRYDIDTTGKHCVIVGNSRIVGAPLSMMLAKHGKATVTVCHIHTKDLASHTQQADILLVGVGKPGLISAEMVKEGAVVIDIGTTKIDDDTRPRGFRIVGDVVYAEVASKSSFITPVPGGVGPMTIACLLLNTLQAAERRISQD